MKFIILVLSFLSIFSLAKPVKIKDITSIKGVRENPLVGYGLVIGLNGTGDGGGELQNTSMKKLLNGLGLDPKAELASKNIASVIVTAKMPAFGRIGQSIDINVSAINGASSLAGGTLLVTPLKAGDDKVYAIASGQISVGGIKKGAKFSSNARVVQGAVIERELELNFDSKKSLRFSLNDPDFTTSARIAKVINQELGGQFANPKDAATVDLIIPEFYSRKVVELVAIIENFKVNTDQKAKIVINERTGTIVAGGNIQLRPVALSHDNLTVRIKDESADQDQASFAHHIEETSTVEELVKALNAIGATPEDMISIFQTLDKNGSINAQIEFM